MTGATACALKLRDRGLLGPGYRADIAIFDPADFRDRATYAEPHRYPGGPRTSVIVNAVVVVDHAVHTGAPPRMVRRRGAYGCLGDPGMTAPALNGSAISQSALPRPPTPTPTRFTIE